MRRKDPNNPSSIFYWKDYESDEGLRVSSLAAQGLWMRLLCIAARAEPLGFLVLNKRPLETAEIARLVSATEKEVSILLDELERNRVFSHDRKNRIYSRRMVRDYKKAQQNVVNGRKGGNPSLITSLSKNAINPCPVNQVDKSPANARFKAPYPLPSPLPSSDTSYPHQQEECGRGTRLGNWSPNDLYLKVVTAAGLNPNLLPHYWMPSLAEDHIWGWHSNLGLSPEQIIEITRDSRKKHPNPPDGPKGLDNLMAKAVKAISSQKSKKVEPPKPPATEAPVAFDVNKFNENGSKK